MFNKKAKIDEQRRERQAARKNVLDHLDKEFDNLSRISDPVEKYKSLSALQKTIGAAIEAAEGALRGEAENKQIKTGLGFGLGSIAVVTGTIVAFHFPPAFIFLCAPVYLSAGTLSGERVRDKHLAAEKPLIEPFLEALKAQQTRAGLAAKDVLAGALKNLADSPDLSVILAAVPELREEFNRAQNGKAAPGAVLNKHPSSRPGPTGP